MRTIANALLVLGFAAGATASSFAADLAPAYKAPQLVAAPYNWTGLYVGGNVGGSWARQTVTGTVAGVGTVVTQDVKPSGVIGGGQIGYNWQVNQWVFGLETDFQGSGEKASATSNFVVLGLPTSVTGEAKLDWFGTVRGRIGYAWDRSLLYFTGGWAYGRGSWSGSATVAAVTIPASQSKTFTDGWTVGGGYEYAFADRWSLRAEYLYIDFGNDSALTIPVPVPAGVPATTVTTNHLTDNVARVALNYKFW